MKRKHNYKNNPKSWFIEIVLLSTSMLNWSEITYTLTEASAIYIMIFQPQLILGCYGLLKSMELFKQC